MWRCVATTSYKQIESRWKQLGATLSGYRRAVDSQSAAVGIDGLPRAIQGRGLRLLLVLGDDRFAWIVWIPARDWLKLVGIQLHAQMRALASYIRNLAYRVLKKLVLNTKIPLLHVGPNRLVGDGDYAQRKCLKRAATCSYTGVSGRLRASPYASRQVRLRRVLNQRRAAL